MEETKLEKFTEAVIRIEEKLNAMKEANDSCHNKIMNSLVQLTDHVNHENELLRKDQENQEKRLSIIELAGSPQLRKLFDELQSLRDWKEEQIAKGKGRQSVYKWATAILGSVVGIFTVVEIILHLI